MCNLYHLAPREHIETYFRAQLPDDYRELAVGPFNTGLFMRANAAGNAGPMSAVMG